MSFLPYRPRPALMRRQTVGDEQRLHSSASTRVRRVNRPHRRVEFRLSYLKPTDSSTDAVLTTRDVRSIVSTRSLYGWSTYCSGGDALRRRAGGKVVVHADVGKCDEVYLHMPEIALSRLALPLQVDHGRHDRTAPGELNGQGRSLGRYVVHLRDRETHIVDADEENRNLRSHGTDNLVEKKQMTEGRMTVEASVVDP